jgi:WhiB family redox-sensing transcriptional regulator
MPSTDMQWQSAASLFSALSYTEGTGSYSLNPTIMNWLLIDSSQILPTIYERRTPTWMDRAKCHGLPGNLFYAEYQHNNSQVQEARSVCLGTHPDHPGVCPVIRECLDYAINNGERYGVWGGCSERERRRIKRQRHREEALANGNTISLHPPPGDRQEPEGLVRNDQAGHPTPWRRSAALIATWRAERAAERCAASL